MDYLRIVVGVPGRAPLPEGVASPPVGQTSPHPPALGEKNCIPADRKAANGCILTQTGKAKMEIPV